MKIAFAADIHMSAYRLQDKANAWAAAVDSMIENKTDLCILPGDSFHNRNIGGRDASTGEVFRAFMHPAEKLMKSGVEILALVGNHEQAPGRQGSALETLRAAGIKVFDLPSVKEYGDAALMLIPWLIEEERVRFLAELKATPNIWRGVKRKIIAGHLTVAGSVLNSGIQIFGSEFEVQPGQLEDLGADLIVLGHIHKRQGHYVGALCQNNFGEEGNPSGYLLYDTETGEKRFVAIAAKEYHTVEIGEGEKVGTLPHGYVKVRFKRKPTSKELEELAGMADVQVEVDAPRDVRVRRIEGLEEAKNEIDQLRAYLKTKNLPENVAENVVKAAEGILKEVRV